MSDDDTTTFELTRRRILGGALTIGAASAATGAGTLALFSDTEQSSGNTVQAGTLDLTLGDGSTTTLSAGPVAPGDSGEALIQVNNDGNLSGSLDANVSAVTANDADPDPEQATDGTRTFEIAYGRDNKGNVVSLRSELGGTATVEIDLSSDPVTITADLPYALEPSGKFDDSITFAFDADDDGIEDFQVAARDYDDDDSLETVYDDGSALPSGSRNRNQQLPSGYDARLENSNQRYVVKLPASDLADPFAITGQANLAAYNPSTSGSNLAIPLIPGFGYNNPPVAGTSAFDGTATKIVEIQQGSLRTLADLLDVSLYISESQSRDKETFVASGKVNRLTGVDAEPNVDITSGETNYVVVEYELSRNVGNAVQGDSVNFDIEVELNQEDSQ